MTTDYDSTDITERYVALEGVGVMRDDQPILEKITWSAEQGQRWVVLGLNGSGKTTLARIVAGEIRPTTGAVWLLGCPRQGSDMRALRRRIAFVSDALTRTFRPGLDALGLVLTGRDAGLETCWYSYGQADNDKALSIMEQLRLPRSIATRSFGDCSQGERQRLLLARAMMSLPEAVVMDEPMAGLDIGAREAQVNALGTMAADAAIKLMVLVTHHLEEIPFGFTHALLMKSGRILDAGPLDAVLRDDSLSECYDVPVRPRRVGSRWALIAEG